MRRRLAFAITVAVLAGSMLTAGPLAAKTINPYVYSGTSFNGADSTAGPFENPSFVAINNANGNVYVLDAGNGGVLDQFNAVGEAVPFSAPSHGGASSIVLGTWQKVDFGALGSGAEVAVDNSGTATQGNIFALTVQPSPSEPLVFGLDSSGSSLGPNWPACGSGCSKSGNWAYLPKGIATDPDGTPWVSTAPFIGALPHRLTPIDLATGFRSETKAQLVLGKEYDEIIGNTKCCVPNSTALRPSKFAFDSDGSIYVVADAVAGCQCTNGVMKYDAAGKLLNAAVTSQLWQFSTSGAGADGQLAVDTASHNLFVNRGSRVDVYGADETRIDSFGAGALTSSTGVGINPTTGEAYVTNRAGGGKVDVYEPGPAVTVPDASTGPATGVGQKSATLTGVIDPDGGGDTTECFFRYSGGSTNLNRTVPCSQGKVLPSAGGAQEVTATISELDCNSFIEGFGCLDIFFGTPPAKGLKYFYTLVTKNGGGPQQEGTIESFRNGNKPTVGVPSVHGVNSDGAVVDVTYDPQGGETSIRVEIGTTEAYGRTVEHPAPPLFGGNRPDKPETADVRIDSLEPDTIYHYRVVAESPIGVAETPNRTFRTFVEPSFSDSCSANALSRQQTGAARLLDCRSYELVSAADQGGYNVVSDLVPGQTPLPGFPRAEGKALYAASGGGIPSSGSPTNHGPDPYLATRGSGGWTTEYVGVPGDNPFAAGPFASPLAGADSSLSAFAFAGKDLCAPCFADGSTGIPVRRPDGSLVQGMQGSLVVADPTPAGEVRKPLSADGSHLLFGSEDKFEADGNQGDVSIYKRNLNAGSTEVVSKTPGGATMSGSDLAALDISDDGSRVLIGELVGTDTEGNDYHHLYMNVDGADSSVDLTPGTTSGALFAGMSSDGSEVYFTSRDSLDSDSDTSADLYRADVSTEDSSLTRVSTGSEGAGDTDACTPTSNWNTPSGGPNCDVVAIAGSGGVAPDGGAVYFLSPEQLDGAAHGTADQPNLYLAQPGSDPRFVVTLETGNPAVEHAIESAKERKTTDFQINSSGEVAAFTTTQPLKEGFENRGFAEVYAFDASEDNVFCVSCPITNAPATASASLASNGLSVTDDGRVFFNSSDQLVLRDTNSKQDVYEYSGGTTELISSGTDSNNSSLLSVTEDGEDAFFFTRAKLAPQDQNGPVLKLYTAREGGGFFASATPHPCKASDECHGAGTVQAPPARIHSTQGSSGIERVAADCTKSGRIAKKAAKRAKGLRRQARRSSGRQARRLRGRAAKAARTAKRLSKVAKRCRAGDKR